MAKYCLKKATKRVSCSKRYKIEKKVKDHNKKVKREAKKAGKLNKRNPNKPIAVPNSCPFKEQILIEAENARTKLEAEKEARKVAARALQMERKAGKRKLIEGDVNDLMEKVAQDESSFGKRKSVEVECGNKLDDKSIKVYAAEVRKTIETADIIIEVLDARDPLGSRSKTVEEQVIKSGKRLVLLLNKIDLVPKENVMSWLKYLRQSFPTIAFKASTQEQSSKLGRFGGSNLSNSSSSKCIGADLVMKLLGNYCRNKDIKTSIRVGLIGYPNVGKSSVINSLKRKRACNVGATPGVTKQIQEVDLDKNIRLLDSPGVVLASKNQLDAIEVALKNAIRIETLDDPVAPIQAILRRCSRETLMVHYNIAEFQTCDQFLTYVARKLGRLRKGGRPDMNAAAKHVLTEWNSGRLRYYTQPPEEIRNNEEIGCTAELISQFSKEFDIDALDEEQNNLVEGLPMEGAHDTAVVYDASQGNVREIQSEGEEEMDMDQGARTVITAGERKKKDNTTTEEAIGMPTSLEISGNVQLNRAIKKAVKKQKKLQAKTAKRADKLVEAMDFDLNKQEDYDFDKAM